MISDATFASIFGHLDCEQKSESCLVELIPHHVINKFGLSEFVPRRLARATITFPFHRFGDEISCRNLKFNGLCHHGDLIPLKETFSGWELSSTFSSQDPFVRIQKDDESEFSFCEEIELVEIDQSNSLLSATTDFQIRDLPTGVVAGLRTDLQTPVDEIAKLFFNNNMQMPILSLSLLEIRQSQEKYLMAAAEVPHKVIWLGAIESDQLDMLPLISTRLPNSVIFAAISPEMNQAEMRQYFDRIIDYNDTIAEYYNQKIGLKIGLAENTPKLDEIHGLDSVKEQIKSALNAAHKNRFLLFCGPPGTGKTYISRSVASELGYGFIQVKGPELLSMYVGESESNIRKLFEEALAQKPVVLLLDEIDSFATSRGKNGDAGGITDRLVAQFATCLDRLVFGGADSGICIIGTTNRVDLLDESLLRPGRFEHIIQFPEHLGSEQILSISNYYQAKLRVAPEITAEFIIKLFEKCSTPARIDELWRLASKRAMRRRIEMGEGEFVIRCEDFVNIN